MRRCCQLSAGATGCSCKRSDRGWSAPAAASLAPTRGRIGGEMCAAGNWPTELRRSYMTASGLPASDHGSQSGDEDVALEGLIEPELLIVAGQLRQPLMSSARAGRRLSISISIRPRDASLQSRQ